MVISGVKESPVKNASSYRGNIEHYGARLIQDDVGLHRDGFTHCAVSSRCSVNGAGVPA